MTEHHDTPSDSPFDAALRQQLEAAAEPEDAGFSLRVMAALPAQWPRRRGRGWRWARWAHWAASSLAACGAAALLAGEGPPDLPHALAAGALLALLAFWSMPSRWNVG